MNPRRAYHHFNDAPWLGPTDRAAAETLWRSYWNAAKKRDHLGWILDRRTESMNERINELESALATLVEDLLPERLDRELASSICVLHCKKECAMDCDCNPAVQLAWRVLRMRLIARTESAEAAAPDLYAALDHFLNSIRQDGDGLAFPYAQRLAEAALAKARGES